MQQKVGTGFQRPPPHELGPVTPKQRPQYGSSVIAKQNLNHLATYVLLWAADDFGRRALFIKGGIQMTFAMVSLIPRWQETHVLAGLMHKVPLLFE